MDRLYLITTFGIRWEKVSDTISRTAKVANCHLSKELRNHTDHKEEVVSWGRVKRLGVRLTK